MGFSKITTYNSYTAYDNVSRLHLRDSYPKLYCKMQG